VNHTAGPWKIQKRTTPGEFVTTTHIVSVKDESHVARIGPCDIEGNAELIRAAPDMLAALEEILWLYEFDPDDLETMDKGAELARIAVKKAKGAS
jgi:hypothetical protein